MSICSILVSALALISNSDPQKGRGMQRSTRLIVVTKPVFRDDHHDTPVDPFMSFKGH